MAEIAESDTVAIGGGACVAVEAKARLTDGANAFDRVFCAGHFLKPAYRIIEGEDFSARAIFVPDGAPRLIYEYR